MTVTVNPSNIAQVGKLLIKVVGAVSAANAGLGQVLNPEGVDVAILRSQLYVKTPSTGAANLGVGVTTTGAKATDIVNDLAVNGAISGKIYNGSTIQVTAKTEISAPAVWSSDKFLTFTGSADSTGFEGYLYVEYIRLP